jgi:hypothetical protein
VYILPVINTVLAQIDVGFNHVEAFR